MFVVQTIQRAISKIIFHDKDCPKDSEYRKARFLFSE